MVTERKEENSRHPQQHNDQQLHDRQPLELRPRSDPLLEEHRENAENEEVNWKENECQSPFSSAWGEKQTHLCR